MYPARVPVSANVGCGDYLAPDPWLNIDSNAVRTRPGVAAVADRLPLADACVDRLYAGHVLEHLAVFDVIDVLAEFRRVLAPGGELVVVGPDVMLALDHVRDGRLGFDAYASMMLGGDPEPGAGHLWPCTATIVVDALRRVGFAADLRPIASLVGSGWPVVSYVDWQFAVAATL